MTGNNNQSRSRRLSPDEHTLWKTVIREIKPLKAAKPAESDAHAAPDSGDSPDKQSRPPRPCSVEPPAKEAPAPPPLAPLDRRVRQRLAKGNEPIDRRLDLHGLTQREAHDALIHFLHAAQAQGARIVLVVTGKGARGAERDPFVERGVLRRLVPQWLHAPELRSLVVGFEAAHVGHGGEGALYVRLRRRRG